MIRKYFNSSIIKPRSLGPANGEKGFTVTEFIVAFAMLLILLAGMIKLFSLLNQSYTAQNIAADVQQVVRTGVNIMSRHIRMAGYNPLKLPDVGIFEDITENSIHFSYDLDADGDVADDEDIRYLHEDQQLKRQLRGSAAESFLNNVSDLKFTYLDIKDQTTSNWKAVKTVVISMTVTEPAGRRGSLSRTYTTRVICRNL